MKTLNRLLLVLLSLALLAAVYLMRSNTTQIDIGHDSFYTIKWPWLHEVREGSIFGVLGWCLLFLRRDPTFARVGLAAVIAAFVIMNWPFNHDVHLPAMPAWH
jgi:hypothetical protein